MSPSAFSVWKGRCIRIWAARSHRVWLWGYLLPATAADDLKTLQEKAAAGTEVTFSADIVTALSVEKMLIEAFECEQRVGPTGQLAYALALAEAPPLPPPAETSPFGGLDGLGDLGFDADALGDVLSDIQDQAGAIMDAADSRPCRGRATVRARQPSRPWQYQQSDKPDQRQDRRTWRPERADRADGVRCIGDPAMMALLKPSYALTMGRQRWTTQLLKIDLVQELAPGINVLKVELPARAPFSAAIDDPVMLELDGGAGSETAFTGTVAAIRRRPDAIGVTALDAGGRLSALRPATTYENVTTATLIRSLAAEVGADVGLIETGSEISFYVADPGRSAWDHVARLCGWIGAAATVSPDNKIESAVVQTATADVALRYGRDLIAIEETRHWAPIESFTVAGESGVGSTASPDVRRPAVDFFQSNRPDGPGASDRWEFQPALRTAAAARMAGAARSRAYGALRRAGRIKATLNPALRPALAVQIQDGPYELGSGAIWLQHARHVIDGRGAITTARFAADEGGGAASLLPRAALGGLL